MRVGEIYLGLRTAGDGITDAGLQYQAESFRLLGNQVRENPDLKTILIRG